MSYVIRTLDDFKERLKFPEKLAGKLEPVEA